ncbi:hypothetical protein QAD02_006945 [Eretmocerus hayati]|uniref:Uncharacterized protein n=1 Tax=Eretmocerus hayati TaxID=131215 RepID=A0ACC2N3K5_9HYME|nr:hypothetical protein QAD02_006945 [Eretmocerus hayati]
MRKSKKRKLKIETSECDRETNQYESRAGDNLEGCMHKRLKRKDMAEMRVKNDLCNENQIERDKNNDSSHCQSDDQVEQRNKKRKKSKKKSVTVEDVPLEENQNFDDEDSANLNPHEERVQKKKDELSKRQLKKEKAELRAAEAREASKILTAQKALNYISKWKHAKSDWKFEKVKQIWLIDNLMDDKYVPDDHFPVVIEYFEGCQGMARKNLLKKAESIIKKIEDSINDDENLVETTEYKRARQLLQALPNEV